MPKRPIIFLNNKFSTQKQFEEYVRGVIYTDIGICDNIKDTYPDKYKTLIKILERHPRFKSKTENMSNIKIVKNKLNKKALEIIIIKNDMKEVDISWKSAITGKEKTFKSELMSAMRSSIDAQICEFKTKHRNECCEECGSLNRLDVDHNDTQNSAFDELAKNFIDKNKCKIPVKFGELDDNTHRRTFLIKDNVFKEQWVKFHKENAKLRMLCHKCNISRPKTKNKLVF